MKLIDIDSKPDYYKWSITNGEIGHAATLQLLIRTLHPQKKYWYGPFRIIGLHFFWWACLVIVLLIQKNQLQNMNPFGASTKLSRQLSTSGYSAKEFSKAHLPNSWESIFKSLHSTHPVLQNYLVKLGSWWATSFMSAITFPSTKKNWKPGFLSKYLVKLSQYWIGKLFDILVKLTKLYSFIFAKINK